MGFPGGGGGYPPLLPPSHAMLTLTVRHQQPRRELHSTLQALHLHPLPLLIGHYHPHHPSLVCHHQHATRCVAWLACHAHHLPHIRQEADTVKEVCEDVERSLQPPQMCRRGKSVVRVKICRKVLYQRDESLRARLCRRYHCHPVADDGVHYHDEYRGGQGYPWVTPR